MFNIYAKWVIKLYVLLHFTNNDFSELTNLNVLFD
jgi:hypothetical protein